METAAWFGEILSGDAVIGPGSPRLDPHGWVACLTPRKQCRANDRSSRPGAQYSRQPVRSELSWESSSLQGCVLGLATLATVMLCHSQGDRVASRTCFACAVKVAFDEDQAQIDMLTMRGEVRATVFLKVAQTQRWASNRLAIGRSWLQTTRRSLGGDWSARSWKRWPLG